MIISFIDSDNVPAAAGEFDTFMPEWLDEEWREEIVIHRKYFSTSGFQRVRGNSFFNYFKLSFIKENSCTASTN